MQNDREQARIVLPDGSVITGQSSFVKSGVTHKLADTELTYDATGYALVRTESMSGTSKVIENKLLKKDGSLAGSIKQTTSPRSLSITSTLTATGSSMMGRVMSLSSTARMPLRVPPSCGCS